MVKDLPSDSSRNVPNKRAQAKKIMNNLLMGGLEESMKLGEPQEDDEDEDDGEDDDDEDDDEDNFLDDIDGSMMEDIEYDDEEYLDDNELTDMLQSTREARKKLKTGGADEMLKEDMEDFTENLVATSGVGKLKGKTRRRITAGEMRLSDEVKTLLGNANGLYIAKDYGAAIALLQDLITKHSNVHQAWNTLGLVHEEMGNKDKALQLRMVAAHMCGTDASLWKELAVKSIENDATQQGLYCLTKALQIDSMDVDALWDRAYLHKQLKQYDEALDGFNQILAILPNHFKVINELAQLYRIKGETRQAIKLYEEAIENVTKSGSYYDEDEDEDEDGEEDEFSDRLGFAEINMLSELYLILNDYRRALDCIKTGIRHVQHRQDEVWWIDRTNDDDEYFGDDEDNTDDRLDLPIELRVRMGICRIYLGQPKIAGRHFEYLLKYPATTYPDLHQDIAYAYFDRRYYEQALNIFQRLIDSSDQVEVDLLIRTADCYREVGDLETAVVFYTSVLEEQPDNYEVILSLAQVYEEQGKEAEALDLVQFVINKKREARDLKKLEDAKKKGEAVVKIEEDEDTKETLADVMGRSAAEAEAKIKDRAKKVEDNTQKASIFDEARKTTMADAARQRRDRLQKEEEDRASHVSALFRKIEELDKLLGPEMVSTKKSLQRDYVRTAQELWEEFSSTRAFYLASKSMGKQIQGFYVIRKSGIPKPGPNLEAHNMAKRLFNSIKSKKRSLSSIVDPYEVDQLDEEEQELKDKEERDAEMTAADKFRGYSFDVWLKMIIRYGYMLTCTQRAETAYEVLNKACEANIFYIHPKRKTALKLALLGCSLINRDEYEAHRALRWFCNFYQFKHDPYRLFTAVLDCGAQGISQFASNLTQRYFSRIIRLMDAVIASYMHSAGQDPNQANSEHIKLLHAAIISMDSDPSFATEHNYGRFYHIPDNLRQQMPGDVSNIKIAQVDPVLLTMFGSMMSAGKNFISAIMFYLRAYALAPNDQLLALLLSINFTQLAMQRKTDNRHMQIMQGMVFMNQYNRDRKYAQEKAYNMGRLFHLIGLTHLAVPHYEEALCQPSMKYQGIRKPRPIEDVYLWPVEYEEEDDEDDETDLKREVAHNLQNIYITSGNFALAQIVLQKYCTI
ncbi:hypothetical protein CLU79DRAFT_810127 [Phycomyces nitens]|nr:hypothetical protein CLU79DRAFT_810127 [Phycomyces nitens]